MHLLESIVVWAVRFANGSVQLASPINPMPSKRLALLNFQLNLTPSLILADVVHGGKDLA